MMTLISANWLFYLIALLIGVAVAFWIWAATGREQPNEETFNGNDDLLEKAGQPVESEPAAVDVATAEPEPVAVATTPTPTPRVKSAEPKAAPMPAPAGKPNISAAVGEPDNLRLIKGVGPKLNVLLNNLGVTRFDQIADWKEAEIAEVDQYLENFSGRITRDAWIDQAKFLAKDDIEGFEKKYGNL
jgi:predicted flap endonuclease-1-like 5' DNA nuclease